MKDAWESLKSLGIGLENWGVGLCILDSAGDRVCLLESVEHVQCFLDRLMWAVAPFGTRFATFKSRMLLQDWPTFDLNLILGGQERTIGSRFTYLVAVKLRMMARQ